MASLAAFGQSTNRHLDIAYNGGMILNPGWSIGLHYQVFEQEKTKPKGEVLNEIRAGLAFKGYYHRRLNTGIYLTPEASWIRTSPRNRQLGASLGIGYLRTFTPNTFGVSEDGVVDKKPLAGNNHFISIIGLRFGKKRTQMEWFIQPRLMVQFPYFEKPNLYFTTEFGISLNL